MTPPISCRMCCWYWVRKLPEFEYQPGGSFRGWMRTVLMNKWRDWPKRPAGAAFDSDVEPIVPDDAAVLEEAEYRQYVVSRALQLMQADFEPTTWKACWKRWCRAERWRRWPRN